MVSQKNVLIEDYYNEHYYNKNNGKWLWHHVYKVKACTVNTLQMLPNRKKATGDEKQGASFTKLPLTETDKDQSGQFSSDVAAKSLVLFKIQQLKKKR